MRPNSQARTGTGEYYFPCSADHEQDWQTCPVGPYSAICDDHTYIHTYEAIVWQFITSYGRDPARAAAKYDSGYSGPMNDNGSARVMRGVTTVKISSMPG